LLLLSACLAQRNRDPRPKTEEHFISVGGIQRRYLLHLPPKRDAKKPAPLILMLHGGGATPEHPGDYHLADAADKKGFLVAYPAGMNRAWNDGRINPGRNRYDDVAFLSAVIDELVKTRNVDAKRVYATGISNGGFMSFRMACDAADKIAAIAPVAGSMPEGGEADCKPSRPVSVLMINGTDDPLVHYKGGHVGLRRPPSEPIPAVVNFWRKEICGRVAGPIVDHQVPERSNSDDSSAHFESCSGPGGAEMINYTIEGGGHTWPGGLQYAPQIFIGPVNQDFSASQVIVDFFSRH
jgi:polyhydroxybutyrate depolymerase